MNRARRRSYRPARPNGETGFLLIEVIMAVLLMSVVIVGLLTAGILSGTLLRMSRTDSMSYAAAQQQMEELLAAGFAELATGEAVRNGLDLTWEVTGTAPKKVVMRVWRPNSRGVLVPDTFVNYMADWGS